MTESFDISSELTPGGYNRTEVVTASTDSAELILDEYDPTAYAPYWHQRLLLALVSIADILTIIIIIARLYFRRVKMHSFRADDKWMMAALVIMFVYFPMQIINGLSGIGLYWKNIHPDSFPTLWWSQNSWAGYYLVCSFVKISMCCCHLHILPAHMVVYRRHVLGLCAFIMALGLFEAFMWLFACTPVASNFLFEVPATHCIPMDKFRYTWVGLSVLIDCLILAIPFLIVKNAHLPPHKKKVLRWVFAANLLGTLTCALSVYGVWYDRKDNPIDMTWTEVPYIVMNNVEVLMYTLGASLPVISPYLIAHSEARSTKRSSASDPNNNRFSWRRASKSNKNTPPPQYADVNRVVTIGGSEPLDSAALDREFGLFRTGSKGSSRNSKYFNKNNADGLQKPGVVVTSDTVHSGSRGSGRPLHLKGGGEDRIQGWTFAMIDEEEGTGIYDGPGWRDTREKLAVESPKAGSNSETLDLDEQQPPKTNDSVV